jgi:hypothetical protein
MKVVAVLVNMAGQSAPVESTWRQLWAAARQNPGVGKRAESDRESKSHRLGIYIAGAAVTALIAGVLTPISTNGRGILWNVIFGHSRKTSQSPYRLPENLQASAAWCCTFTQVDVFGGFYWSGTVARLDSALNPMHGAVKLSDLTPAGAGAIEIPLQTSGSDPIYVAPPKVIIRSLGQNPKNGMVAVLGLGGQGSASPGEFIADVDDASPVTVAYKSSGSQYYYVSSGSPEILILIVTDINYNCRFDIKLIWREQGHLYSRMLTNNGQHFHILGSSGFPWYGGDPRLNLKLVRIGGRPFSSYAP